MTAIARIGRVGGADPLHGHPIGISFDRSMNHGEPFLRRIGHHCNTGSEDPELHLVGAGLNHNHIAGMSFDAHTELC